MKHPISSQSMARGARAVATWLSGSAATGSDVALEERIAADIEAFVRVRSRVSVDDSRFSRESNLWQDGYLDSIGVVELIGHIEDSFGVAVPDETLFDPGFTSVDGIAGIVSRLPADRTA